MTDDHGDALAFMIVVLIGLLCALFLVPSRACPADYLYPAYRKDPRPPVSTVVDPPARACPLGDPMPICIPDNPSCEFPEP